MAKLKKIVDQILGGRSDSNLAFKDICNLLTSLGFDIRIKGSYYIFRRTDVEEK
jgi:hypothetical protein